MISAAVNLITFVALNLDQSGGIFHLQGTFFEHQTADERS